ncbi:hypothetical protein H7J88_04405 [Mycolicibacterium flavescens]|uniref:Uncharacterized protein n=1 Tax=Mycolicibacterium flavescens TaxID=1776 RepID=A0A1E3R867_MYCFV|nr:hypothetical protein [Mycolicibacterium flavescens]MCV7278884.1 hypothetical protein [Mycolicibacterium flavescens]ODQ85989.1 hypothetical protein BHQ18_27760 [Mycolicibacterium flavescens]
MDEPENPATDRVRRELARLARDESSAEEVPPDVSARIGAALRHAPAHTARVPLSRARVMALVVGLIAVVAAAVIGTAVLARKPQSPFSDHGPTAEHITVSRTSATPGQSARP